MRKLLLALLACILLMAGAAAAETIELTGEHSRGIALTLPAGENTVVILRNANLKDGLRIGFEDAGGQTGESTVTLEIYGKNTIASPAAEAVILWGGNCNIVSGEQDATLSITGGAVKSYFHSSSYDQESQIGLRLIDGDVTIAANNVTIQSGRLGLIWDSSLTGVYMRAALVANNVTITGDNVRIACGSRSVIDGVYRGGNTSALSVDGVVSIGGDQVKLEGCVTNSNYFSPAVSGATAVYILGTQARPIIVETGGYKTEAMEGTPFTTQTDVLSEAASQGKLWTKVVTPTPVPTATPAPAVTPEPAVPTTGDGANIALWLGMLLLAAAGVISLRYRRARG